MILFTINLGYLLNDPTWKKRVCHVNRNWAFCLINVYLKKKKNFETAETWTQADDRNWAYWSDSRKPVEILSVASSSSLDDCPAGPWLPLRRPTTSSSPVGTAASPTPRALWTWETSLSTTRRFRVPTRFWPTPFTSGPKPRSRPPSTSSRSNWELKGLLTGPVSYAYNLQSIPSFQAETPVFSSNFGPVCSVSLSFGAENRPFLSACKRPPGLGIYFLIPSIIKYTYFIYCIYQNDWGWCLGKQ